MNKASISTYIDFTPELHSKCYCNYVLQIQRVLNIEMNCPNPSNSSLSFTDWLEHIWITKYWYNKIFQYTLKNIILLHGQCGIIEIR